MEFARNIGGVMELEKAKKALNYQLNMRNTDVFMTPNFEAIETLLQALEELQQKEKSRIIGNINEIKIEDLEPILKPHYISKEKVKEGIESIEDYFDRLNGPDEDIDFIREVKQELLEGK